MSAHMEKKLAQPVDINRLLGAKPKIELIFNADVFQGQVDVRCTDLLAVTPKMIAVGQTSPPILKSMILKEIEATFVQRDPVTMKHARWGWDSQILGVNNNYVPEDSHPDTLPRRAVFIALPHTGALRSSNVRLDYRLMVSDRDDIRVETTPAFQGTKLVNFSAGGAMIATPGAPQAQSGERMQVRITFPWPDEDSQTSIKSLAEVVRVDYVKGDKVTLMGLHFQEMATETNRILGRIINYYMLAEQRLRNTRY